jgi:ribonuclease D
MEAMEMHKLASLCSGDIDEATASDLESAGVISWDIETSGLDWRYDKIATCQLHNDEIGSVLVKTDGIPTRLRSLIENPSILKIFHHAMFDLRFLQHQWGAKPANIACTKIASKLIYRDLGASAHSLKPLLKRTLGVDIDKSEQLSNWTVDTLTESQLRYAINDVIYLKPLLELLSARINSSGNLSLMEGCFAHLPTRVELDLLGYEDVFTY